MIKKLIKKGKHAELWGGQKANNNHNQLNSQFKNLQIDSGKGGNGNKGQGEKGSNNNNQMQIKGGNPGMPTPQQLQQFQQLKGLQDMKMPPQFKDLKIPMNLGGGGGNPKTVKFDLPDEDGFTDDEFDDDEYDDDDDEEDDDFDDEMDLMPPNKMKPMMDNGGGAQMPNIMHLMNGKKGGIMPQMNMGGGNKGGNGNNGGVNQIQGGGSPKKSVKSGGGHPQDGKNFGSNGGQNKNSGGGHGGGPNFNSNGGNKGGGMNNGLPSMPNMMAMKASVPNMGPMPTGHMGQMSNLPMGQIPAVQGLPAPGMSSVRSNGGYFHAGGPEIPGGNPYHQQQMAAAMMNQQHANGNERFQPMMYAPQPPAVNYLPPPYPYYPYPPPPSENYGSMFSDENPSACKVM